MANVQQSDPLRPEIVECSIENLEGMHPQISANDWRSPLVMRMLGTNGYSDGHGEINVDYRWLAKVKKQRLRMVWQGLANDFAKRGRTYQAPVITEYATLGLACVLVAKFPQLQITEVTRRGEKADYWLGDREYMLEVSGQQSGDIDSLRDKKRDQLLDNPFGRAGFVCVAVYDRKASYLWFYEATQ
jgi:hypothetical protein